jgi:RNA polymerase sigma factor (sigma-70 family)
MNPDLPWLEEELAAHSQWVRRLARSLVHDESAAEDLVQDTWVAALRRPPADRRALRGWLARVVRTLAWKQQRKVSTAPLSAEEGSLPGRASDSELVERLELHRVLAEELRAIREPLRTTLLQRYFEGLSAAQIAERTGTPAPCSGAAGSRSEKEC